MYSCQTTKEDFKNVWSIGAAWHKLSKHMHQRAEPFGLYSALGFFNCRLIVLSPYVTRCCLHRDQCKVFDRRSLTALALCYYNLDSTLRAPFGMSVRKHIKISRWTCSTDGFPPQPVVREMRLKSRRPHTVIPRLTKRIRSGITFVSRNLR
jgi:hypothetical protein